MTLVAVYSNGDEVIVLPVDQEGKHIGIEQFFDDDGPVWDGDEEKRNTEDYNITVGELPLQIECRTDTVLTFEREVK